MFNSECEEPQIRPPGPGTDIEEIRATDMQRPPRAQEPQKNHRRDHRDPPREEQERITGEPPSSHTAEAPGSCSDLGRLAPSASGPGKHSGLAPRPRNHTNTPHHCHWNDSATISTPQTQTSTPAQII
ncbi:hypothetical protein CRENBAI_000798 [Crenichthys baileyi]|uniref:Uncharacterized protein n=1 Tax=Crenichthys baileyi TaxID=28760 RepID=A0AAV9QV41_9TELE